jgi:hypothetical protein
MVRTGWGSAWGSPLKQLRSVNTVVEALGGIDAVIELTGANNKQTWNWTKRFQSFPAKYYACMIAALNERGYTAPARLWAQEGSNITT